jgi:hypothetical protein
VLGELAQQDEANGGLDASTSEVRVIEANQLKQKGRKNKLKPFLLQNSSINTLQFPKSQSHHEKTECSAPFASTIMLRRRTAYLLMMLLLPNLQRRCSFDVATASERAAS